MLAKVFVVGAREDEILVLVARCSCERGPEAPHRNRTGTEERGQVRRSRRGVDPPQSVVAHEKEVVVPQDWAADDSAELVASIGRLVQFRPLIECRLAVERPIAKELVAGSMPRICTRLRDDVDHGGTRAAVLRRRTVGVDAECLHGPLTYLVRDARRTFAADRIAGNAAGVIEPVDENPVRALGRSITLTPPVAASCVTAGVSSARRRYLRPAIGNSSISVSATKALACVRADSTIGGCGLSAIVSAKGARRSCRSNDMRWPGSSTMSSCRRPANPSCSAVAW